MHITLAYYHGGESIQHRLIRWWTGGPFSHVELLDTKTGLCWSSSSRDGGVRKKFIDVTNGNWTVVQYDLPFESDPIRWFELHEGHPYDWNSIWNFVWCKFTRLETEYICSVAVAQSLGFQSLEGITPMGLQMFLRPYEMKVITFPSTGMRIRNGSGLAALDDFVSLRPV